MTVTKVNSPVNNSKTPTSGTKAKPKLVVSKDKIRELHKPEQHNDYNVFNFISDELSAIVKASAYNLMTKVIGIN